jgi:hypothetical protein
MALILGYYFRDRFTGGCNPLALPGGCAGGGIFHDKAKNNRDKMRCSNLSNIMT